MTPPAHHAEHSGSARWTVWGAGLVVALGAGAATAHGLYEVAVAAGTPMALAWLYPLITDGLALVAYATTARLAHHGRRYAWAVVITAAGLSGLTQASYLAGGVATAPPALRFAIGAWPAIAAAIAAHLLFLLGTNSQPTTPSEATPATAADDSGTRDKPQSPVPALPPVAPPRVLPQPAPGGPPPLPAAPANHAATPPDTPAVQPSPRPAVQQLNTPLNARQPVGQRVEHPPVKQASTERASTAPAADRARTVAREHATRHGQLPTVRELARLARVARGTAAAALQDLRTPHEPLTTTPTTPEARTNQ